MFPLQVTENNMYLIRSIRFVSNYNASVDDDMYEKWNMYKDVI